jgi:hypothetical protein
MVSWVRPYLQGVESEAVAQRLNSSRLYEWRWYSETVRFTRMTIRFLAQRYPRLSTPGLRELPLYGRWRRTNSANRLEMPGPADRPPPDKK